MQITAERDGVMVDVLILAAREALATAEAAALNRLWDEAVKAANDAAQQADKAALWFYRTIRGPASS